MKSATSMHLLIHFERHKKQRKKKMDAPKIIILSMLEFGNPSDGAACLSVFRPIAFAKVCAELPNATTLTAVQLPTDNMKTMLVIYYQF